MQLQGRRRVDGVGRPKFDFHTGPCTQRARTPLLRLVLPPGALEPISRDDAQDRVPQNRDVARPLPSSDRKREEAGRRARPGAHENRGPSLGPAPRRRLWTRAVQVPAAVREVPQLVEKILREPLVARAAYHEELDTFVEAGVNFLDTAELYPVSFNYGKMTETWIGNWLTARIGDGTIKREDFYIATKCDPAGVGLDGEAHDFSAEKLEASARASIERLRSDYIDLFYLHFPSRKGFDVFGWGSYGSPERYKAKTSDGSMADFERQVKNVKVLLDKGLVRRMNQSVEARRSHV